MINEDFKSISEILKAFPDEQTCMAHLEELRWNGIVISPFDEKSSVYVCKNNRYRCRTTGKYFNAKTNTLFYNSKIDLQKWFIAIWLVTTGKKSISSLELSAILEITQKSAWMMIKNIKVHFELSSELQISKEQPLKKPKKKKIEEIEVVVEKDKLHILEWLQHLKKNNV